MRRRVGRETRSARSAYRRHKPTARSSAARATTGRGGPEQIYQVFLRQILGDGIHALRDAGYDPPGTVEGISDHPAVIHMQIDGPAGSVEDQRSG